MSALDCSIIEEEIEDLFEADIDTSHPVHRLKSGHDVLSVGTGATDNACQMCSPSSNTRCSHMRC